jgi:DNA-binding NtrC family response regulator
MARILLIDNNENFRQFLQEELEAEGFTVMYEVSAQGGFDSLLAQSFDLVLLDVRMPGMTGFEFLKKKKERQIETPVIMMANQGTSETIIEAEMLGAFDYVDKDLEIPKFVERLNPIILRVLACKPSVRVSLPDDNISDESSGPQLLGKCHAMKNVCQAIGQVAPTDTPVLIQGETGTGKDLVAQAIHNHSQRSHKPYLAWNVAGVPESLLESELFGTEPNAYTGAVLRAGWFESADGGTLFLDEIGEMPCRLQVKLLRAVENGEITRLGAEKKPIKVDVRLISATHCDLESAVREGTFRADLYFRLNVFPILLPPLRERDSDLRLLGRRFLVDAAVKARKPVPSLDATAIEAARDHSWPGNVRELKDRISRAVLRCRGAKILPSDLGLPLLQTSPGRPDGVAAFREAVEWAWDSGDNELWLLLRDMLECELLKHALAELSGNKTQVAKRLGMVPNTIRDRMKKYGLD